MLSDLIGGFEGKRDEDDVGKRKEDAHLAMVTAKHFSRVRVAWLGLER